MKQGFASRAPTDWKKNEPFFDSQEAQDIKARVYQMFNNSTYLEFKEQWKRIRELQLPYLGSFLQSEDETNQGRKRDRRAKDGEAWRANLVFAGGMASGLTPQSIEWFKFNFQNGDLGENHIAKVILDARLEMLNRILANSNFYNATHNNYLELAFGQSPLGIFEDPIKGLHFEQYPIGSYAYEVNHLGMPCSFAVKKKMTPYQLKEKFGMENLPLQMQEDIKNNKGHSSQHTLVWLVEKNKKSHNGKLGSNRLPYLSLYWIDGDTQKDFIRVSGFHEFPVAIARYQVIGSQAYGFGPGWYADGDNRMLYRMLHEAFANLELFARPALQAPSATNIDYRPGGISMYDADTSNRKIEPLLSVAPVFEQIFNLEQTRRDYINRAYNTNLFAMLDQNSMDKQGRTAYELSLRNQEKMQLLGPVVERQNTEFLGPSLERSYSVIERSGMFPEFPPEVLEQLQGEEIKIEYVSPLAQAQKMSGVDKIEMGLGFLVNAMQIDPSIADLVDLVEHVRLYYNKIGADTILLRSDEAYEEIQKQKAEAAQQEKQEAMALESAKVAPNITQAASNINDLVSNDQNAPLDSLLGAIGGGGGII